MRMISTIKTAAQDRMQVNATMVVAMITARPWSGSFLGEEEAGNSVIYYSWIMIAKRSHRNIRSCP
jgi:hypothetical protein